MSYLDTYRRMLLDMHIPDHDPSFLERYDPAALASLYERANVQAVMLYCNSHVGLLNYPSETGRMHAGLHGRDVVGELVGHLRDRDIRTCAYYSVLFDNQAVGEHPEWWISPVPAPATPTDRPRPLPRYGICCPNKEAYVDLTQARISELLGRYDFDCLFYDMTFWAAICGCVECRERYLAEEGAEIPTTVDWYSPKWCRFQAARERWLAEFVQRIVAASKAVRPDMPVYNNFALSVTDWTSGFPLDIAREVDFLGGDMYGDRTEQLVVSKLMANLTQQRPAEFMTSLCVNLRDHVRLRDRDDLLMRAYAATAHSSATLFIDAIDPDGGVDAARYDLAGSVFSEIAPYEPYLGGEPIEDVAVYHSSESRMSLDEIGTPTGSHHLRGGDTPHQRALRGACRMLQRAHIPFGVITRKQLDELDRYAVVVLPNVTRMDIDEVYALRDYVHRGGCLYASGNSSLVDTAGARHSDFMLADVFGVACDGEDVGTPLYARASDPMTAELMAPQRYVSLMPLIEAMAMQGMDVSGEPVRIPDVRATTGRGLATLSYPYRYPKPGTVADKDWSSIHSWPPHLDTDREVIVANTFHEGSSIYSAFDLEATDAPCNERLFVGLVRHLLGDRARFEAGVHPAVWVNAFHRPLHRHVTVSLVNHQHDLPPVGVRDITIRLRAPSGEGFTDVVAAPDGTPVEHGTDEGGVTIRLASLERFALLVASY
jgi:hypothetical protein